jgi:hypothetical protein
MTRVFGRFLRRNSIALLALFLALGGTSYAAATLISGTQIKPHTIAKNRLTNKAIKQLKGNRGPRGLPGAAGSQGARGPTGPQGSPDTPAQVLDKLSQNAGYFYFSAGHGNWQPFNSTDPMNVTRYSDTQGFFRTSTGASFLTIHPSVPTSLYGNALKLVGVELCYHTNTGNSITYVQLTLNTQTTDGQGGDTVLASDATARTDATCRLYAPSSPQVLTSNDELSLYVAGNWTTAGTPLYLGRTTFVVQATNGAVAGPVHAKAGGRLSTSSH